uniref:ATPase_AAA_core domain-containing protein n=1 Tax=Anisakis simplex TaxID=6269 RepID=A0A0M3JDP8_ANISI
LEVFCSSEALKCCCDLEEFRMKTENFVIGDLKKLSQRIILETLSTDSECIRSECVERALRDFRNISSKIEKPNNAIKVQWNDVGGMHNVKKLLEEVFVWPIKYSSLFRNCAIRAGRGVLLYGASGCGKTLIARA